jgi:tetratricopeptide (TPR) repeat protein
LPLYDRAVDCYERSGDAEGVAKTWAAKATALKAMDRAADAERLFKLADEQLQTLGTPVRDDLAATRARLLTNRAILAAPAAEQLQHAQAAADILILLVRERGWHELAGDLGRAQFVTGQAYEDLGRPRPALDAYREARTTFADAVVRDGRSEWAGELADAYNHESTLVNVLEGPAAALAVSTRALKLWQQLADLDGSDSWAVELAKVRQQLGRALMNTSDLEGARHQFDEALRAVPNHMLERPGARLTTAHTLRSYGVLARTTSDPEAACDYYQQALAALGAPEDHQKLAARALILESFASALGDLGDYDNAIRAQQASTADVETSAGQGRRAADLAGSYQRLSNVLLQSGNFNAAKHAATKALAVFEQLIADGRDELVEEAARQRSVYAFILHRLSDIEGAVIALTSACKTYASLAGADEQLAYMARMLGTQLDELREITALRPRKRPRWLARQRSSLERAGRFSRAGNSRQASQQIEAIVGSLGWLNRRHPTVEGHVLAGQAGNYLGVTAMRASRNDAARHGFTTAIHSYRSLVAVDRRYIDEWAKAYIGLASLLAITNDAGGSNEVLRQLETSIGEIDPSAARRWRKHADATIASLR